MRAHDRLLSRWAAAARSTTSALVYILRHDGVLGREE
jgi:hypothetical protein